MFLPIILLRNWGWPGFWVFAIFNVLGCAGFGYWCSSKRSEELCRELHASLPHRPFPILVMTSMTARDQRDWARDLGSIEFLEKPVSPRRIAALLAQLLSQEKHNA